MLTVKVTKNHYTVEGLYQWDSGVTLEIHGLSVGFTPEIHFTNSVMTWAIIQSATVDASGVIRATIPDTLLRKPYDIIAYVCAVSGSELRTLHKIVIPVKSRQKPDDYTITTPDEVYSLRAIEATVNTKLTAPLDDDGNPITGEAGQVAVSDGSGGIVWKTINTGVTVVTMTEDEYAALEDPDANTLYVLT